jgi:Sigma-70, region 4
MGSTPDPERLAFSRELGALMESAIDRLPDGAREVFILRQVEGMSTEEVADALDVSEAVVKTRLSRHVPVRRCAVSCATTLTLSHRIRSAFCDRDVIASSPLSSLASCESPVHRGTAAMVAIRRKALQHSRRVREWQQSL